MPKKAVILVRNGCILYVKISLCEKTKDIFVGTACTFES